MSETLRMIQTAIKKGIHDVQLHLYTVLVGTEIYDKIKNNLEFMDYNSDITDSINIENCREIIHMNPHIFPHFYDFYTNVRKELIFLDRFINFFYVRLYKYLKRSLDLILLCYDNDLIKFFKDFRMIEKDTFIEIFSTDEYYFSRMTSNELTWEMMKGIKRFLEEIKIGREIEYIKEVLRFKMDCFYYLYMDTLRDIKIDQYKFDILKGIREEKLYYGNYSLPIKVRFHISEDGNLKVRRLETNVGSA